MSGGIANQVSSVRRIAQIPQEGGSIVDGALPDVANGLRVGGRDDQATSLGQSDDANEAGKPSHGRHSDCSAGRVWTSILALQRVLLEGIGRAAGHGPPPGSRPENERPENGVPMSSATAG